MQIIERFMLKSEGNDFWQEVSREIWVQAERRAGFRPKLAPADPAYATTPATAAWSSGGAEGRIERVQISVLPAAAAVSPSYVEAVTKALCDAELVYIDPDGHPTPGIREGTDLTTHIAKAAELLALIPPPCPTK